MQNYLDLTQLLRIALVINYIVELLAQLMAGKFEFVCSTDSAHEQVLTHFFAGTHYGQG